MINNHLSVLFEDGLAVRYMSPSQHGRIDRKYAPKTADQG